MNETIKQRLHEYVDAKFVREDEVLAIVRQQTAEHGLPQINLQPHEGLMVQLFVRMCAARKVVEVGTLAGYSAIWIARALPDDGTLDHHRQEQRSLPSLARSTYRTRRVSPTKCQVPARRWPADPAKTGGRGAL